MKRILRFLALFFAAVLLAAACRDAAAPRLLADADSAMVHGRYRAADSLIASYAEGADGSDERSHMYLRLLQQGMKDKHMQPMDDDLLLLDSLRRYYDEHGPLRLYARALFYSGCAYRDLRDNPTAVDYFLKALRAAEEARDSRLLSWIYAQMGDMYYSSGMEKEYLGAYRHFYACSYQAADTLQMALAAFRMGKVSTLLNMADSAVYYYQQSLDLSSAVEAGEDIASSARKAISDIFTQTENYDRAREYITRDSLYDTNWAYLYLGENRLDSAAFYFQKVSACYDGYARAECLRMLAEIFGTDNPSQSRKYYSQYVDLMDSMQAVSQTSEVRQAHARYNYRLVNEQRSIQERRANVFLAGSLFLLAFLILLSVLACYLLKSRQHRHAAMIATERWLREKERSQSQQQLEENAREIARLEQLLEEASRKNDATAVSQLELTSAALKAANEQISARLRLRQYSVGRIKSTGLYQRMAAHAGDDAFKLTGEEKSELVSVVDKYLDNFTGRLNEVASFNADELCMCCLTAVGFRQKEIARMLCKTESAISMARLRLIREITHDQRATAKDFAHFIEEF